MNRTESKKFFAGGKGINVSGVLKNLGIGSVVPSFAAGFTGDVSGIVSGLTPTESLRRAVACGSASAFSGDRPI